MNKRVMVLTVTLICAACVPVQPAVNLPAPLATSTYGLAGQSVIVQATNESLALTSAVLSAQIADATERAAEATAAWQATQSALSVEQTQAVMRAEADARTATAQSQSDIATATAQAMAGQATQESEDTATAQAFNGALLQQAISATGTALAIRASSLATQEAAKAEEAKSWQRVKGVVGEVFQWGMVILIFGSIIIGLYYATLIGQDARNHRRDMQHQLLLQAGAETAKATIIEVDKKNYQVMPDGALVPFDQAVTEGFENKSHASKWRAACKRLVYAGVQLARAGETKPFTEKALAIQNPIVTHPGTDEGWSDGYRILMDILKSAGVMYAERGRAATWAKGWDLYRFEREFDLLPLPKLPDGPPPDVRVTLRTYELSGVSRTSELPNSPEDGQP